MVEQLRTSSSRGSTVAAKDNPRTHDVRSIGEAHNAQPPGVPGSGSIQPTVALQPNQTESAQSTAATVWTSDLNSDAIFSDDSYFSFDEFAQNALLSSLPLHTSNAGGAGNGWPSFEQTPVWMSNSSNMIDTRVPADTPHTFTTTVADTPGLSIDLSALESNDVLARSVDLFFRHMYPTYPVLDEDQVRMWVSGSMTATQSEICMLWAMCAATLVHVDSWPRLSSEQRTSMARSYIEHCIKDRMNGNFLENSSFCDVLSSLLVAIAYFELRCRTASWVYVREAITLATAVGMHDLTVNTGLSDGERVRRQRCYALLFITERGASVLDNFPVTILATPALPNDSLPNEDSAIAIGLRRLCDLFSLLDFSFVRLWNDYQISAGEGHSYIELATLQGHLRRPMDLEGVSDIQRADILITQQWLRLVFWQAALRLGLISTNSAEPAFTYDFPMEIASALCEVVKSLPPVAIQVHGLGIVRPSSLADWLCSTLTRYSVQKAIRDSIFPARYPDSVEF